MEVTPVLDGERGGVYLVGALTAFFQRRSRINARMRHRNYIRIPTSFANARRQESGTVHAITGGSSLQAEPWRAHDCEK
jgi:hypothetical protein